LYLGMTSRGWYNGSQLDPHTYHAHPQCTQDI
jgi:hypothetical protein